jgi:hypothetical protein
MKKLEVKESMKVINNLMKAAFKKRRRGIRKHKK